MKSLRRCFLIWTCLILTTGISSGQVSKIAPDLLNLLTGLLKPVNVIVQYNNTPGLVDLTKILSLGYSAPPAYMQLSGTSMAAPVVSGAAAILLQREPGLTPDTVKARLMKTASKTFPLASFAVEPSTGAVFPSTYDTFTIGAGYLDLASAINNRDTAQGAALSPSVLWSPLLGKALVVKPASSTWDNATWSLGNVWGSQVIQAGSAAWGDSAVWGDSAAWGSSAAWGDSSRWGTSAAGAIQRHGAIRQLGDPSTEPRKSNRLCFQHSC